MTAPSKSELSAQLAALNEEVAAALLKRHQWMGSNRHLIADVQIGEVLYNLDTAEPVGTVSEIYFCCGNLAGDWPLKVEYVYAWWGDAGGNLYASPPTIGGKVVRSSGDTALARPPTRFGSREQALAELAKRMDELTLKAAKLSPVSKPAGPMTYTVEKGADSLPGRKA